jgi:hypothetical protein
MLGDPIGAETSIPVGIGPKLGESSSGKETPRALHGITFH